MTESSDPRSGFGHCPFALNHGERHAVTTDVTASPNLNYALGDETRVPNLLRNALRASEYVLEGAYVIRPYVVIERRRLILTRH